MDHAMLNIPTLFGTTENAVYGQLFCALIVYVLLKWLFDAAQATWPNRLFLLQKLPMEWLIQIQRVLLQSTFGFMN
ncbi:hypothetical protein UY286_04950 [Paenibacillus polymyxa]|uniref:hypothetical protein n=1 Tax=Paenibacillus polymyxa TaxID=1406 RepID=UPI002AB589C9|nr:hypothetical protein [Paenibacillus polymyxa]MDY7989856.1 hypothetical protein [Paenibacillus polymyxa]MDY8116785.1 hypothetical protein [Paenibacillus polymyxa]